MNLYWLLMRVIKLISQTSYTRQVNDVIEPGTELTQTRTYDIVPNRQVKYYTACVRLYTTIALSVAYFCAVFVYLHSTIHMLSARSVGYVLGWLYGVRTRNYGFNDVYVMIFQTFYYAAYVMDDHVIDSTVDSKKRRILKNCYLSLLIFFAPSILKIFTILTSYGVGTVTISTNRYYLYLLIRAMYVHYARKKSRRHTSVQYYIGQTILSYLLSTTYMICTHDDVYTNTAGPFVRVMDTFAGKFLVIFLLRSVYGYVMWKLVGSGLRSIQTYEINIDLVSVKTIETLTLLTLISPTIVMNVVARSYIHVLNFLIASACGFKLNFLMRRVYTPMITYLNLISYVRDHSDVIRNYVRSKTDYLAESDREVYEWGAQDQVMDFVIMDLKAGLPYVTFHEQVVHFYVVHLLYSCLIQSVINAYVRLSSVFKHSLIE